MNTPDDHSRTQRIIVIGASAGGFEAIQTLVAGLPSTLPASIFIVWHMSPEVRGILPQVLNKYEGLPAANAYDGELIEQGRIYVAPPDRHLVLEEGRIRVTRGPKENRFRPAVDPLFRSAAYAYGSRVIGVILSGALDDGTSGLWAVKQRGGVAIVQHPRDAAVPSMPESALREVTVDYSVPIAEMPALLERLCSEPIIPDQLNISLDMDEQQQTRAEIRTAMEDTEAARSVMQYGELSPYACPDCHGVLTALREGGRLRFRCHTGHAFSTDSLLAAITVHVDDNLWSAIRAVEESMMLMNQIGDHAAESNQPKLAAKYFQKAQEADQRLKVLKQFVVTNEPLSNELIAGEDHESS